MYAEEDVRAHGVRQAGDLTHRVDRADRVGRAADRDEPRSIRELRLQIVDVERAVFASNMHLVSGRSGVGKTALVESRLPSRDAIYTVSDACGTS